MAKSNEPIWWALFSAGGVVAAFFIPVTIILTGIAIPVGLIDVGQFNELIRHPLARVYLFVLISLPLFHWAHRFRYALVDLGLTGLDRVLTLLFYGLAIVGTSFALYYLLLL